jgi:hypothetical protein
MRFLIAVTVLLLVACIVLGVLLLHKPEKPEYRFSPVAGRPEVRFDNATAQNCWAAEESDNPISKEAEALANEGLMKSLERGDDVDVAGKRMSRTRKLMQMPLCSNLLEGKNKLAR